ncbi:MAG: HAD family hydrolase, partial [Bacteroidaceae bacterium]|nr:HAD family hydrolase [Bacteroidaceae bacterium]
EGIGEDELFSVAASLEAKSEHPLARAIVAEGEKRHIAVQEAENFKTLPGNGIEAELNGAALAAGNRKMAESRNLRDEKLFAAGDALAEKGKTPLYFARGEKLLGMIAVADVIKSIPGGTTEKKRRKSASFVFISINSYFCPILITL